MTSSVVKADKRISDLLRRFDEASQATRSQCARFLSELGPLVDAVRGDERQRDRQLACRFNTFNYVRTDELGLSRIIADLLDPTAEHGQGTRFLKAMLDALPETRGHFASLRATIARPVLVETERRTTTGGRIDITVDIPLGRRSFCLAFENKPYAADQALQLKGYLEFLSERYGTGFLLVYLPPDDRKPDDQSLPRSDRQRWRRHFAVMPYAAGGDRSLEDWFAACRKLCDAERVSWFLRDAQLFCQQQFGESTMTADAETRLVREYLSNNPKHLRTALAVHNAWRLVRADVCERFLEHLRQTVEKRLPKNLLGNDSDLHVQCRYGGEQRYSNRLWISRDNWIRYDGLPPNKHGRTAIMLQSHGQSGPNGWLLGVRSPKPSGQMTDEERQRRADVSEALRHQGLFLADSRGWWPQCEPPPRYPNWYELVPELSEEYESGGGPITECYVSGLVDIAAHAIPAINDVEMANRARSRK